MRILALSLFVLSLPAFAVEEESELDVNPKKHGTAKRIRKKGMDAWAKAEPVWIRKDGGQKIEPKEAAAAVEAIEDAVFQLEKSLHYQWVESVNATLVEAVKAWYSLRSLVPAPVAPQDPKKLARWENEQKREARKLVAGARKFMIQYMSSRKYGNQYGLCGKCSGRKSMTDPFGGRRTPCSMCKAQGMMPNKQVILEANWLAYSPLYRQEHRNQSHVERILRDATRAPERAGPFLAAQGARLDGKVESHDVWVRIKTEEREFKDPKHAKRPTSVKRTYTLYRVGKVWYLHTDRYDEKVLAVPPLEGAEEKK